MRQTLEVQSQNGRPRSELSALLSVLALLAAAAIAKFGAATQFFHIVHAHAANVPVSALATQICLWKLAPI